MLLTNGSILRKILQGFWEVNKKNTFNNIKGCIVNFLENYEGLKQPSFFEKIISLFSGNEFIAKENILDTVTKLFLKKGQHKLK